MVAATPPLRFAKMHGAGNDFVVLDLRGGRPEPAPEVRRRLADRHRGVGCDQLIAITDANGAGAVAGYRIWNTDGSPAGQCGNGARCVAAWLVREGAVGAARFTLHSPSGPVTVDPLPDGHFRIGMGRPRLAPAEVPFLIDAPASSYHLDRDGARVVFAALSMGNPHAVVEVADIARSDVPGIGAWLQARPEFPEGVNVGFAQVLGRDSIALRVFERGVGETLACGSGACAAVVALVRQGRIDRTGVRVRLPGGELVVDWPDDAAEVHMAGPTEFVFQGDFHP